MSRLKRYKWLGETVFLSLALIAALCLFIAWELLQNYIETDIDNQPIPYHHDSSSTHEYNPDSVGELEHFVYES